MKKQKRIIASILAFFIVILAACDNGEDNMQEDRKTIYEKIQEKGVITIGTEGTYRPFSYRDEKEELRGYDIEVAKAVADKLGLKTEFREINWDGLFAALDTREIDLVMNQAEVTKERKEKYDFSEPYLYSYAALITAKEDHEINDWESARGKEVALNASGSYMRIAEKYRMDVKTTDSFQKAAELLKTGQVDCVIDNTIVVEDYLKEKPGSQLRIADIVQEPDVTAIPIPKGNTDFLEAVNKALSELKKDGTLARLSKEHFGQDFSRKISVEELKK